MLKTSELVSEVISLPVDVRTVLVDKLLESLNPKRQEIDMMWAQEAEKRISEIKTGKVKTISGEKVFSEIREKFNS